MVGFKNCLSAAEIARSLAAPAKADNADFLFNLPSRYKSQLATLPLLQLTWEVQRSGQTLKPSGSLCVMEGVQRYSVLTVV